jgi:hypothetical protein
MISMLGSSLGRPSVPGAKHEPAKEETQPETVEAKTDAKKSVSPKKGAAKTSEKSQPETADTQPLVPEEPKQ